VGLLHTGGAISEIGSSQGQGQSTLLTVFTYWWVFLIPLYAFQLLRTFQKSSFAIAALLAMCWFCFVAFFSPASVFALKDTLRLILMFLIAAVLGVKLTASELFKYLTFTVAILLVSSFLTYLFLPSYGVGVGAHSGAMLGVFDHKNHFGRFCALAVIVSLINLQRKERRLLSFLIILSAMLGIFMSRSINSIAMLGITIFCYLYFNFESRIRDGLKILISRILLVIFGSLASLLLLNFLPEITGIFGRDSGFTGRNLIWAHAIEGILAQPLLGYGLGVFWILTPFRVAWGDAYIAPHAHNGYLQLCLDGGLVGFVFVACLYYLSYIKLIKYQNLDFSYRQFGMLMLSFILFGSIAETIFFKADFFLFLFFAFVATCNRPCDVRRNGEVF
jgi:exopolysaccharide production protein ExoQ